MRAGPLRRARGREHLTEQQVRAAELMVQGLNDTQVAERLRINRTTLYRWRVQSGPFRAFLDQQRRAALEQSADRVRTAMLPAIELLAKQVADAEKDPTRAQRAAALLLKLAMPRGLEPPPPTDDPRRPPRDPYHGLNGDELVEAILADARRREQAAGIEEDERYEVDGDDDHGDDEGVRDGT